jgi:hypothetical protein
MLSRSAAKNNQDHSIETEAESVAREHYIFAFSSRLDYAGSSQKEQAAELLILQARSDGVRQNHCPSRLAESRHGDRCGPVAQRDSITGATVRSPGTQWKGFRRSVAASGILPTRLRFAHSFGPVACGDLRSPDSQSRRRPHLATFRRSPAPRSTSNPLPSDCCEQQRARLPEAPPEEWFCP